MEIGNGRSGEGAGREGKTYMGAECKGNQGSDGIDEEAVLTRRGAMHIWEGERGQRGAEAGRLESARVCMGDTSTHGR